MNLKHPNNTTLQSTLASEKKQFLNILKRIKYRYEHQSTTTTCTDLGNQPPQPQEIQSDKTTIQTHVPASLLKGSRKSVLSILRDRRNCYNLYPLLENQQIEKNFSATQKPEKKETLNVAPKQKICNNFDEIHRFPKLKQMKLSISTTPAAKKGRRDEQRKTTVLCCVSKLKNTLKVHKKIINKVAGRKQEQKENQKERQHNTYVGRQIKYSFHERKIKNSWKQKLTFHNYSKHDPTSKNDLSSWNLEEDDTNSFQNLIF